jgi:hypothetical protein
MKQASPKDSSKVGPKTPAAQSQKPNVVYFLVDNLGMGELSSYIGGRAAFRRRESMPSPKKARCYLTLPQRLNAHRHARR